MRHLLAVQLYVRTMVLVPRIAIITVSPGERRYPSPTLTVARHRLTDGTAMLTFVRMMTLLALVVSGSALTLAEKGEGTDEKGVDRFLQMRVKPMGAYVGAGAIVSLATGVQVATPGWMQKTFGSACEKGAGAFAYRCIQAIEDMKKTNPLGLTLYHGIVTKACADLLAQTIPQNSNGVAWIDPLRLFRSMLASLMSTSIPFYYWTRFMARSMASAPEWLTNLLGGGFFLALFKTVVTQVLFRPVNVALFLGLQSIFRGDSARQLVSINVARGPSPLPSCSPSAASSPRWIC